MTSTQIGEWTGRDPKDSGWPAECPKQEETRPYWRRRYELQNCVLWGSRVVVPPKCRSRVKTMLHEAHPGIVRMKSLARGYVWWPKINAELEGVCKSCVICQTQRKTPPVVPLHPWALPNKPWSRVHMTMPVLLWAKCF